VATDADLAGRVAAERDFWMLSCYQLDPSYARLPDGTDPAELLTIARPTALTDALAGAQPLGERLLDERMKNLAPVEAVLEATRVVAARPSRYWDLDSCAISARLGVPMAQVRHSLLTLLQEWNTDPRRAAQQPLQAIGEVKRRISAAVEDAGKQPRMTPTRSRPAPPPNPQSTGARRRIKPSEPRRIPRPGRGGTPQIRGR
jgi:DNA primase